MQTSHKGNASEARVIAAYIEAGFIVSLPFGGGAPYDLIVDTGRRLLRVQVKTGRLRNGCVLFPTLRHSGRDSLGRRYQIGEFDIFAVFCPDNDGIYVFPHDGQLTGGCLRCAGTKNSQRRKVRWARDYLFEFHVTEIRKEVELVGLEPTAS